DRAPLVPGRVDRDEAGPPIPVGHLVAAQELLAGRVEARVGHVRVDAQRVAVPDVDQDALERHARAAVDARDGEGEREADAILHRPVAGIGSDVGALELLVHEIRALGLLRAHDAGRRGGGIGGGGECPARRSGARAGGVGRQEGGARRRPQARERLAPVEHAASSPILVLVPIHRCTACAGLERPACQRPGHARRRCVPARTGYPPRVETALDALRSERRDAVQPPRYATYAWATLAPLLGVLLWRAFVRATGSGAGAASHA